MVGEPLPIRPAHIALNVVAFQCAWFGCALGAAFGFAWVGVGVATLAAALHLALAHRRAPEVALIATAMVLGAIWDSLWLRQGWIGFAASGPWPGIAPLFMIALWMAFATTLNVSLRWLGRRYALAACLGAVGGPLAYYAGERLGALAFADLAWGLTGQAIGWGVMTPALVALAQRLDGFRLEPAAKTDQSARVPEHV